MMSLNWAFITALFMCFQLTRPSVPTPEVLKRLTSKTPYKVVQNLNSDVIHYKGCEPLKAWMIIRHGTRNPSADTIRDMNTRLPELKQLILEGNDDLPKDIQQLLKNWKPYIKEEDEKILVKQGQEELIGIAERMQDRFPTIFQKIYSPTSYYFRSTNKQRAEESLKAFTVGLFGKHVAKDVVYPKPEETDLILRFYKMCKKWKFLTEDAPAKLEYNSFRNTTEVQNTVRKVETTLGLPLNTLNIDDVQTVYLTCSYEYAFDKQSPWCFPLDPHTAQLMEYLADLKHFWADGYAYPLSYEQACVTFQDMLTHLENDQFPRVTAYFTHSGTLLKILGFLGLYNDHRNLTHDNMDDDRLWKTSKIDTFANNLAFLSFRCGNDIKLLMMHQERIKRFAACPNSDLCPVDDINDYYKTELDNCDFENMCKL